MSKSKVDHFKKALKSWWDEMHNGPYEGSYMLELLEAALAEEFERGREVGLKQGVSVGRGLEQAENGKLK